MVLLENPQWFTSFWCMQIIVPALTLHICSGTITKLQIPSRGGAVAARVAHNHEVAGSSPAPATKMLMLKTSHIREVFYIACTCIVVYKF